MRFGDFFDNVRKSFTHVRKCDSTGYYKRAVSGDEVSQGISHSHLFKPAKFGKKQETLFVFFVHSLASGVRVTLTLARAA